MSAITKFCIVCATLNMAVLPLCATTISPFTLDLSQLGGSSAFGGITIASGLNFPYGMTTTSDGSILWGKTRL